MKVNQIVETRELRKAGWSLSRVIDDSRAEWVNVKAKQTIGVVAVKPHVKKITSIKAS